MKKSVLVLALFILVGINLGVQAQDQKIGYFESEVILAQIPEYNGIEQRLQLLSDGWQQELDELDAEIEALEEDYKAKEILYTEEIRDQKKK